MQFQEDSAQVQLQMLTAVVKLFLKVDSFLAVSASLIRFMFLPIQLLIFLFLFLVV
jgi:hypothetical protein